MATAARPAESTANARLVTSARRLGRVRQDEGRDPGLRPCRRARSTAGMLLARRGASAPCSTATPALARSVASVSRRSGLNYRRRCRLQTRCGGCGAVAAAQRSVRAISSAEQPRVTGQPIQRGSSAVSHRAFHPRRTARRTVDRLMRPRQGPRFPPVRALRHQHRSAGAGEPGRRGDELSRDLSCFAVLVDHVPAAAQAARTAWVSCGVACSGHGPRNLAAMMTRRSLMVMSS